MSRRHIRLYSIALIAFIGLAFLTLHPLIFNWNTHGAGYDYFNYHWNFWWTQHALTTPGESLFTTDYVMQPFTNNLGYHALTLAWFPLWALLSPVIGTFGAMNAIIVTAAVLNGFLTFALLRHERVTPALALLGGAALQIAPTLRYFYYNTHINLMDWFWLPAHLLLWGNIVRAAAAGRFGRALLWAAVQGVALWGLGLTDLQFPIFVGFLLVPYGLYTLWTAPRRVQLIAAGLVAVGVAFALLWFAGPLPYMRQFSGALTPGVVEDRPGIPLWGFFWVGDVWWHWNVPTLGAAGAVAALSALLVSLRLKRGTLPRERWLWFWLLLPPLVFALGPYLYLGNPDSGARIPLPYHLLFNLTDGMFRMPWRLAPIYLIAAMLFAGKTWSPLLARRFAQLPHPPMARPLLPRVALFTALLFALFLDARLFDAAPLDPLLPNYAFYEAIGQEAYDYVVLEVPTAAGTGELLLGDYRAIQFQFYGMTHAKRTLNGFISRAPLDHYWYILTDDPMLAWLGQRRPLEPARVEAQLRERITDYPIGYVVVHQEVIGHNRPANEEILGFFNSLPDLLCPVWVEADAVVYRTAWHPDGCPARVPPQPAPEIHQIDVGAAEDVRYIGWGWHYQEEIIPGLNVRWAGAAPQADLYADLPPGSYTLAFTAQAFHRARQVEVQINGVAVGRVTVPVAGFAAFELLVPAELIGSGAHVQISLIYDGVDVPADLGIGTDTRRLAVMVDWVRLIRAGG